MIAGPLYLRLGSGRAPGARVGIDAELIAKVVESFYARIHEDGLLGPIFATGIADWDAHLVKMRAFWATVTLMTGGYKGDVIEAHFPLPGLTVGHFQQWLALFDMTLREHCDADQAAVFRDRAHRISERIRMSYVFAATNRV